jgi:hypothetical protein
VAIATRPRPGLSRFAIAAALLTLATALGAKPDPEALIIHSERDIGRSGGSVTVYFHRLYGRPGLKGASSHSGRGLS